MKVFDQYARYYDLLYRDKDYRGEAEFVLSVLRAHADGKTSVFEMGCGTGIHAQLFAEAGYEVHGIDLSETMLATASKRRDSLSSELRERLNFSVGDVRSYRAGRKFDVVLSLFHVFSYQTDNTDLQAAFATANVHLESDGILIFDYWYGPAVLTQRPETRVKRLQDNDFSILRIAESQVNEQQCVVEVNYETFVKTDDTTEIIRETHRMRYLFLPEIELFAELHGFEVIHHREWLGATAPSSNSWAGFSVLRKK